MEKKVKWIPMVTTSKEKFLRHILHICKIMNVPDNLEYGWIGIVEADDDNAHYFINVIYTPKLSFFLILHELVHHMANKLRYYTISEIWYRLDQVNEYVAHLLFTLKRKCSQIKMLVQTN